MRNQIILVLDSVGYDVFIEADLPNLKSVGEVHQAISQGFWTLPAVASITAGSLPYCKHEGCWHRKLLKPCFNIFKEKEKEGYTTYVYTSNGWVYFLLKPYLTSLHSST